MPYARSNPFFSPEGRPKPFPGVKRDVLDGELTTAQTFKAGFERRKVFQSDGTFKLLSKIQTLLSHF